MVLFGYSPADLVPFSHEAWLSLLSRYNEAQLPMLITGLLAGAALIWLVIRRTPARLRAALVLLALCWAWIGYAFMHQALGRLLWSADWLAWAFALQALLLLLCAALPMDKGPLKSNQFPPGNWVSIPIGLILVAAVLWPIIETSLQLALQPDAWMLFGEPAKREWLALSVFGTAPDPTALATIAFASVLAGQRAWLLLPIPVLWLLLSASMLAVLGDPLSWLPLCALAAGGVAFLLIRLQPAADE